MRLLFTAAFILSLMISSCVDDTVQKEKDQIIFQISKNWEVHSAKRSGKNTESLTDGFIYFDKTGSVLLNFDGTPNAGKWTLKDKDIIEIREIKNQALSTDYKIQTIRDTLLVLSFKISNTVFEVNLVPEVENY